MGIPLVESHSVKDNERLLILSAALVLLNIYDYLITLHNIRVLGAVESNPIMAPVVGEPVLFFTIKTLAPLVFGVLTYITGMTRLLVSMVTFYFVVGVWNTIHIM